MKNKKLLLSLLVLILLIALFAAVSEKPRVERQKCVGCGDCLKQCPTGAISLERGRAVISEELCIDCNICVKTCTYRAIRSPK